MALNKVTFLLLFSVGTLLFISPVLKRSNEPEESIISILELRRATLLKHCSSKTKKSSQELSVKKLPVVSSLKPALKNLHFIRNLPGDLVFCLLKKAGSTSLTHFFTNNLEPADEVAWLDVPDEETQEQIVKSRSSLRVMVIRHPFTRLVSAFNHLFRRGLREEGIFLCANTTEVVEEGCQTENAALAEKIIRQTRPGSKDTLLRFPDFVRFLVDDGNEFAALKKQVSSHWPGLASHWQPFSHHCSPCHLLPNVVLELETLSEELPFVLQWSGLVRMYGQFPTLPRMNQNQVGTNLRYGTIKCTCIKS